MAEESNEFSLSKKKKLNHQLYQWWKVLQEKETDVEAKSGIINAPASRAARAELRRADTLTEVMFSPHYQRLYQSLKLHEKELSDWQKDQLAAVVGLLALIREDQPQENAVLMSEGEKPVVSELRFRRLLACTELEDVYGQLRRLIPLMGNKANVQALIEEVGYWHSDRHPTPRKWAYDYHWLPQSP